MAAVGEKKADKKEAVGRARHLAVVVGQAAAVRSRQAAQVAAATAR